MLFILGLKKNNLAEWSFLVYYTTEHLSILNRVATKESWKNSHTFLGFSRYYISWFPVFKKNNYLAGDIAQRIQSIQRTNAYGPREISFIYWNLRDECQGTRSVASWCKHSPSSNPSRTPAAQRTQPLTAPDRLESPMQVYVQSRTVHYSFIWPLPKICPLMW